MRHRNRGLVVVVTVAAALLIGAAPALANTANPLPTTTGTVTENSDGSVTVTVQGTWDWQSQKSSATDPCGGNRFGAGWAIAWSDSNAPGQPVKKGGVTMLVGTPGDNSVHFDSAHPCGYAGPNGYPLGPWGPESHTYVGGAPRDKVCVIMYDLHDTPARKPGDFVAGGSGHNGDNSLETNSFDPNGAGFCFDPVVNGTQVPVTSMGLFGLSAVMAVGLVALTRRRGSGSTV